MLNIAIGIVLACLIVLSILFRILIWPTTGGFIILVAGTYLLLRFSSARFYLKPNVGVHATLICSYLLIGLPIWKMKVLGLAPELGAIAEVVVIMMIMIAGVGLLAMGLTWLLLLSNMSRNRK